MLKEFNTDVSEALPTYIGSFADVHTDAYTLLYGDCLERMKEIESSSVDLILADPPYGTTACKWDSVIDLPLMWEQLKRIIKPNGAIVMTASQPFTTILISSNIKEFKCSWVYKKRCASNFAQAKYMPMKEHEDVLVFCKGKSVYYPIKEERKGSGGERVKHSFSAATRHKSGEFIGTMSGEFNEIADELRYPSSVQEFNNRASGDRGQHPTQKPVALMEYLIKTYTNESETVLDFTMGSGTTGVACINTSRKFIGIEQDENYFNIAANRIKEVDVEEEKVDMTVHQQTESLFDMYDDSVEETE